MMTNIWHKLQCRTHTHHYSSPDALLIATLLSDWVCFWNGGGGRERRKRGGGNSGAVGEGGRGGEGRQRGRLITCLASSKDVCSLLISFSYCSLILSTSWSWAATSSFRAPFRAVSSLSRLLSTSSWSSLARRASCISTFSCIISCGKWVWQLFVRICRLRWSWPAKFSRWPFNSFSLQQCLLNNLKDQTFVAVGYNQ